ncbi:uncharacterized protein ACBT44_003541 isoform 2-T2 [Syngnathus typhle]
MVVTLPCLSDQRAVVGETSGAALHSSVVWPKDLVSAAWSYKVLNLCNHQRADRAVSSKDAVGKSATYWPKESTLESRGDKSWSAKPATTTLRSFTWSHAA